MITFLILLYVAPPWCYPVGDCNCDSRVDFGDVNAFVLAQTEPDAYTEMVGTECDMRNNGDLNCDGVVDFADIDPFVEALTDPEWTPGNRPPVAYAQTVDATEDEPAHITLTGFDPDGGIGCP